MKAPPQLVLRTYSRLRQTRVYYHLLSLQSLNQIGDSDSCFGTLNWIRLQVLELGVVVHSVIIGVSLGASDNPRTIKPLVAALTFHQLFEGIGLGGCISQAKFESQKIAAMVVFFCLTTPVGIGVGMGMSSMYQEGKPSALVVEGLLNSASAGILTYMALVDLIAADYMNPIMLHNLKLQMGANLSLLLGSASMSVLATWA